MNSVVSGYLLLAVAMSGDAPVSGTQTEETFVLIHEVSGQRMSISQATQPSGSSRSRGRRGRRGGESTTPVSIAVSRTTLVTSAMREQRTLEFRVGMELPKGLRHSVFRRIAQPLEARIVSRDDRVVEINVITLATDINHANRDLATGDFIVAVKPKRPPRQRRGN